MRVRFPLATPAGVFLCLDFFIQKTRISHVFENAGRMRVAQRAGREAAGELPLAAASPIGTGQVAGAGATGMPFPIRTEEILRVQIAGLPKEDRQLRPQALCQQGGKQSPFDRRMGWAAATGNRWGFRRCGPFSRSNAAPRRTLTWEKKEGRGMACASPGSPLWLVGRSGKRLRSLRGR